MQLSWSTSVYGLTVQKWILLVFGLAISYRLKQNLDCMKKDIETLTDTCLKLDKSLKHLNTKSSSLQYISSRYPHATDQERVAPSLDHEDDVIILYNRVPKTGSTTFAGLAYDLCETNDFHVLYFQVNTQEKLLGLDDQMKVIKNITEWTERRPAIYHGHLPFIDFSKFGVQQRPIYINLIREPLDRLISYYYFLRYGDDFRPEKIRSRAGDNETFDECVMKGGEDCDLYQLWLQIPYFCGHHPACRKPGNEWALQEAKRNLFHNYLVVGVTEELESFVSLLEAVLPRFYKGASALYKNGLNNNLRHTSQKNPPNAASLQKIKSSEIYRMERNFYDFALNTFHITKRMLLRKSVKGSFIYEKIRPQRIH